ncbi:STAS domain-containing protein [Rhodococcus sp. NPDC003322]
MLATATLERRFVGSRLGRDPLAEDTRMSAGCHTAVVIVVGDLDAALLPTFLDVLDRALTISRHSVVIDLSAVQFLSAAAALALGPARERAWLDHLDLSVLVESRGVERALEVTGMRNLVRCDPKRRR